MVPRRIPSGLLLEPTGPVQIWAIPPDGSRLELLRARTRQRHWSGSTHLVAGWAPALRQGRAGWNAILINLDLPLETRAHAWSASADPGIVPQAWSPDGRRIAAALEQGPIP